MFCCVSLDLRALGAQAPAAAKVLLCMRVGRRVRSLQYSRGSNAFESVKHRGERAGACGDFSWHNKLDARCWALCCTWIQQGRCFRCRGA